MPVVGEVVRIDEPIHAWNVDGSSSAIPSSSSSWIAEAEARTGRRRGRCSYEGCGHLAEVGGHVWVARRGVFIAPICHGCNRYDNAQRMQDAHARLRGGIEITRAEFTEDMRVSERRFGSPPQTPRKRASFRECCACGVDVSDRPEGHDSCYDCYRCRRDGGGSGGGVGWGRRPSSSAASRARRYRPCERCGEDISERPSTHFLCLSCYHRNRS